jgi:hypothetical protein
LGDKLLGILKIIVLFVMPTVISIGEGLVIWQKIDACLDTNGCVIGEQAYVIANITPAYFGWLNAVYIVVFAWWLADIYLCQKKAKRINFNIINKTLN